jgi:hypothetical protein
MSSGTSLEPYVRQGDDVATIDSAQLVDPRQKELSNSLRLIQHAKKSTKVSACLILLLSRRPYDLSFLL